VNLFLPQYVSLILLAVSVLHHFEEDFKKITGQYSAQEEKETNIYWLTVNHFQNDGPTPKHEVLCADIH
jgi:hypothetical protein